MIHLRDRRYFWVFLLVTLVGSLCFFQGCGKKGGESEKKKTVIRFTFWGTPEQAKGSYEICKAFEKEHPNIKVRAEHVSGDYNTKLMTMFVGGSAPDVLMVEASLLPVWADKGILLSLDPYIERGKFYVEDFHPVAIDVYTYKEHLYGLDRDISPYVLFYNKDLFDEVGVSYPDETWDWDKFLSSAKKLTRDIDGDGKIDQFGFSFSLLSTILNFIWQNGGDVLDDPREPTKCIINEPEAVEAIQFLHDLRFKHYVVPRGGDLADQGYYETFMTGKVAIVITMHYMIADFKKIKVFKWDCAPLPKGKAGRASYVGGLAFAISSRSKHPEEAWEFVKFAGGIPGQTIATKTGRPVPSIRQLYTSDLFLRNRPPDNQQVFIDSLDYVRRLCYIPKINEVRYIINQELEYSLLLDKRPVQESCDIIVKRINRLLREK